MVDHRYIGNFKDDKQSGEGVFIFKSGTTYKGLWENGKRNGEGT